MLIWLAAPLAVFAAYAVFCAVRGGRRANTADDYFIAGRGISVPVFALAATATSFSGWTFLGYPALVARDGFPYAYAAFAAVVVPLTGVVFLKRQWMLGRRFGYLTPGEMLADYFQGETIRLLSVAVALLFALPFFAVQLAAAGHLASVLSDGRIHTDAAIWGLAAVVLVYVAAGGLRAVAEVGAVQYILLALAIAIAGWIALDAAGGWEALRAGMAKLAASATGTWGTTQGHGGGDYNAYFAIPGVIQFTAGVDRQPPVGGPWTGIMVLTSMVALLGVQAAPGFSMWSFAAASPRAFAAQQVWASALGIGIVLFVFAAVEGIGGLLRGVPPAAADAVLALADDGGLARTGAAPGAVAYDALSRLAASAPWLAGLVALGALAALQAAGALHLAAIGGVLTRDLYRRHLDPAASDRRQKRCARIAVAVVLAGALLLATHGRDALIVVGGLAVAVACQMWTPLAAVTWVPWITRQGATWGVLAGIVGVVFTEDLGLALLRGVGIEAWGRWPWTIHAAAWGMVLNLAVGVVVSALTQDRRATAHRMTYHAFLAEHAGLSPERRRLKPIAWVVTLSWMFFAIGPGAVIGNHIFGLPDAGVDGWTFGIPSIWAWQILMWLLGVATLGFLAYRMEMSAAPATEIAALPADRRRPG